MSERQAEEATAHLPAERAAPTPAADTAPDAARTVSPYATAGAALHRA